MTNLKEELSQNYQKETRAQKSLDSAKKSMGRRNVEIREENPHIAQL